MDDAVKKGYLLWFYRSYAPALYEPMIAKEQFKNIVEIEETYQTVNWGRA